MSTHAHHPEKETFYFVTFTCYRWLPLFEETEIYDYLTFWFSKLKEKGCLLNGYVIMPNHMHFIVYIKESSMDLSKILAESKRFLAYKVVKRLKEKGKDELLEILASGVQLNERVKGKKHQVFRLSFDAKPIDEKEVEAVLDYIHRNPVSGVWDLVSDFVEFKYSSAGYYEIDEEPIFEVLDYREVVSESSTSDSEG